ncbi:aconitate hydratase A [Anaerocolumna cellulosilytica]|uniref:Aconitate hydratase n=1 Tax=Anaerocolumna cellulosilytica TaxID=433286 RepID=A0A6S6R1W0_9FIRM|nr:aconitate hydratase AcnA [Anaerocolumna cellulosilytica]MBB5194357.1 aconitate hydratase [Anaerocolumna cellulosilytica]BCJ93300.1 aconitate hydratase A [Anaerocolumna cellulosilytica]
MKQKHQNNYLKSFQLDGQTFHYYDLSPLEAQGFSIKKLPYTIRILLEGVLRQYDGWTIKEKHIMDLAGWKPANREVAEVPFKPSRVILQDFTGVPAVVDLASMRNAMEKAALKKQSKTDNKTDTNEVVTEHIKRINPEVLVDLVIDHSVQVDYFGTKDALSDNMKLEFERNMERYRFLKWAKEAFSHFRVVPPATGIIHQVNLEYLAKVVNQRDTGELILVYPDTLVGTDSHTTMINGLGVLGWGVGGIEAEAGMLGQPSFFPVPDVVGVRLTGELPAGATATDLALLITQLLRSKGVVNKFVEFFGEGIKALPLADRATIANMAPEYGATCGYFPVDEETLRYLELTGRNEEHLRLIKTYLTLNHLFYEENQDIQYSDVLEVDMSSISASLSGPKRPQDLIPLPEMKQRFLNSLTAPVGNQGHGLQEGEENKSDKFTLQDGRQGEISTGAVAIASITSCTNTSNPYVMLGAGLLAKKAVEKGLTVPAHVKTSLAPGSKVVTGYLIQAGLQEYLDKLGFQTVGYGCATCIGNSGSLLPEIEKAITEKDILVTSVLSGNRNFEGRIHPLIKANYLASPILVVAYALAGTVCVDFDKEPMGIDADGNAVYLRDIWPSSEEISRLLETNINAELFIKEYKKVYEDNEMWNSIQIEGSSLYEFAPDSTYIRNPPFFEGLVEETAALQPIKGMRIVGKFGDSITTDHISPAGFIGSKTPAGKYLLENGVEVHNFNTYGSRRGNHEVMMRGTFANIRIRNQLAPDTEGGVTTYLPTKEVMSIYDACMKYKADNTPLMILAGKDYGMGSSRDWAAKGTSLLGIRVILAESYERIHRSNLVMMGVLPLEYVEGHTAKSLGLTGEETYEVNLLDNIKPQERVTVTAVRADGTTVKFQAVCRFDSEIEVDYYRHGGILSMVLREKLKL